MFRVPLHLVSAWASRQRLVLGQQACEEKSNQSTALPALLARLELTCLQPACCGQAGALVTIDAMGCQTRIAEAIRGQGELSARSEEQRGGSARPCLQQAGCTEPWMSSSMTL